MRREQIFTRLTRDQTEALDRIGRERKLFITRNGQVNRSEVIRVLLAEADDRLMEVAT